MKGLSRPLGLPLFVVFAVLVSGLSSLRAESILANRHAEALEVAKASGAEAGFNHVLARASGDRSETSRAAQIRELVSLALSLQENNSLGMAEASGQWILGYLREESLARPNEASLPFFEGWILERHGDLAEAERAYLGVLELDPDHGSAIAALERLAAERNSRRGHVSKVNYWLGLARFSASILEMPRKLRIECCDAIYHSSIFESEEARDAFGATLFEAHERFG